MNLIKILKLDLGFLRGENKKIMDKKKVLVTSIFSFSLNVSESFSLNFRFYGKGVIIY